MRTRKATIPATPFVETTATESVAPETFNWSTLIKGEATWKRWACAMIAGLASSAIIGFLGGTQHLARHVRLISSIDVLVHEGHRQDC